MKTQSMITIIAGLLVSTGFAFAQAADIGRCGQERGTCGNECAGDGFFNQGRGQGKAKGNGKGLRRGQDDGTGKGQRQGEGKGQRRGPRDGSGPGCNKGA